MADELETDITEITIAPDGRLRIFGLSREVIELLRQAEMIPEESYRPVEDHEDEKPECERDV